MRGFRRLALVASVAAGLALAPAAYTARPAHAYGPLAVYQVGFSSNCDNPAVCGSDGLGGFWGWVEFDSDGTGDAQLTGCQHFQGGTPAAGAQHFSVDIRGWTIAQGGTGMLDFYLTSEVDTISRPTGTGGPPVTVAIPSENADTFIPATPGHYTATQLFGMKAPAGVSIQIQVTKIPNR